MNRAIYFKTYSVRELCKYERESKLAREVHLDSTKCFIYYRKSILQITQPSKYRCTHLQYRFAVISEAPSYIQLRNTKA